ncbi:kinase-like domain-containing protein [Gigaspora rosea]|uniref:Kinase-like domain-containing protein n=1 Tax=Gigaspora rosea TaxID=44941 RepID=A0A397TY48_9GLOM|nr:kinase-like domain-containing protein [Gigaspora rosea]
MGWKDKLTLLHCIASDLEAIHSQNLIHRDLHSGNILQDNIHSAYIADLGLVISTKMEHKGVYGVLPYVAPEVLTGRPYTKAFDIYSFGMIMWEVLYGKPAFYDETFGSELQSRIILHDLRPPILEDTESCYVDLMKLCWAKEPEKRPSSAKILETLKEWQNDKEILAKLTKSNIKINQIFQTINKKNVYSNESYRNQFISYINLESRLNRSEDNSLIIFRSEEYLSV